MKLNPFIATCQSEDRQCCSLIMQIGRPLARISTALSTFRPNVDCDQLSVAYSPITKNDVVLVRLPSLPPRSVTASRHSRLEPKMNVPVKQNNAPLNSICGAGSHRGNAVALSASPISKSLETNLLRSWNKSSRSASSISPSSNTSANRCSMRFTMGFWEMPSFATNQRCMNSISLSERKSSAITPRAIPMSSVTCLSSKRARLYEFFSGLLNISENSILQLISYTSRLHCLPVSFNAKLFGGELQ